MNKCFFFLLILTDIVIFQVTLKKVDLTEDYSLYLNWKIDLDQYYCDALFIYRETKTSEILINHIPVS